MIKAIIFDCFGVLLTDSLDAALGVSKASVAQVTAVKKIVLEANWGRLSGPEGRAQIAKILGISAEEWGQRITNNEGRNEALLELIKTLRPRYKTAMLSNVSAGGMLRRFSKEEIKKLFDEIILSGEMGFAKPDRQIYEHALSKLEVEPEEAVFIDDREDFCIAAEKLGINTIHYENYAQFKVELDRLLAANSDSQRLI